MAMKTIIGVRDIINENIQVGLTMYPVDTIGEIVLALVITGWIYFLLCSENRELGKINPVFSMVENP